MKFINTASFHSFSFESIYIKIEHVQIQENYERTEARQMSIIDIITPVFMMTVLIAIGVITSKVIDVSVETRRFISFVAINFALPAVIMYSIFQLEFNSSTWSSFAMIYACALGLTWTGMAVGYGVGRFFHYTDIEARQLAIVAGCSNSGFIGIPLITILFGPEAGSYAAVYDAGTTTSVFTIGILLLKPGRFSFKQLTSILNTPFLTLVCSVLLASAGLVLPMIFLETVNTISGLAAPLAMILIGLLIPTITSANWKMVKTGYKRFIGSAVIVKVLAVPAVACLLVWLLPIPEILGKIIIVQSSMPTITLAAVLFERYVHGRSNQLGIVALIATTIFSLLMLPLTVFIAQQIA
ncbi:AEC family transporter [uncultured Marinococcus sp.]|uniref:AEC family transporter n=1 Tax=uncultured Marinococcus sp. TaxID=487012 RepID=UPI00260E3311|nr:AEC family transporter [uncultured Marinococcus sp.]